MKYLVKIIIFSFSVTSSVSFSAVKTPEFIFNKSCGVCHNGQMLIAPKKGDVKAWKQRLDKGMDTLIDHVTNGYNMMPPTGLCADCNAKDYEAVIRWMSK